jgi:Copper type II ascorbate-dependent monooxygenase, C-terminal domain
MGPSDYISGLQSFLLYIHYGNPHLIQNITDTTVLRIHYTLTPRQHELGVTGFGDYLSNMRGDEIPAGLSQYYFYCSPDCSKMVLNEPVTVIGERFHMHRAGLSAVTYHVRNDEIIRQANVDYYEFPDSGKLESIYSSDDFLWMELTYNNFALLQKVDTQFVKSHIQLIQATPSFLNFGFIQAMGLFLVPAREKKWS